MEFIDRLSAKSRLAKYRVQNSSSTVITGPVSLSSFQLPCASFPSYFSCAVLYDHVWLFIITMSLSE